MAQAPQYDVPTVSPEMPNQPQASPADFGAQIGEAMQGLGQKVEGFGDVLAKHAMWRAQIEADSEKNEGFTNNFKTKNGVESNFYTLQGKDAQDALPGVMQQYDEINKATLNGIKNPKARIQLQEDLARQDVYTFNKMSQHAASQSRKYADDQAAAKTDLLINSAPQADDEFDHNIDQIKSSNEERAKIQGWSTEQTQLQNQLDVSRAWSSRVLVQGQTDPRGAYEQYQNHKDQFTPEARLTVERSLAGSLNGLGAKQLADQAKAGAVPNGPAVTDLRGVLGFRESGNNYTSENTLGFAGRYQFGAPRLQTLGLYAPGPGEDLKNWNTSGKGAEGKWSGQFSIPGFPEIKTLSQFLNSPGAQEKAWEIHDAKMEQEIKTNGLDKYEGQTVQGVLITHDGLKAMMHLGGTQGAINALTGHGGRDDYGTTVLSYARLGLSVQANPRIAAAFGSDPTQGATPHTTPEQLEERVALVRKEANMIAPNDATLADNAENQVRADQNRIWTMDKQQQNANYQRVLQEVIVPSGTGATSPDQLSEAAKAIFYNLDPLRMKAVKQGMLENTKENSQGTPAGITKFLKYKQMWQDDPGQFQKHLEEIASDGQMSSADRHALINLGTSVHPQTQPRFDMGPAMQVAAPALDALDIGLKTNQDADKYWTFMGRYTPIVKTMTENNRGDIPGDDKLIGVVRQLLNTTVGDYWTLGKGGPAIPLMGSYNPLYNITIEQVPDPIKKEAAASASAAGVGTLDDEGIVEYYIAKRMGLIK